MRTAAMDDYFFNEIKSHPKQIQFLPEYGTSPSEYGTSLRSIPI